MGYIRPYSGRDVTLDRAPGRDVTLDRAPGRDGTY